MRDLTKAQLTIGILASFAVVCGLLKRYLENYNSADLLIIIYTVILHIIVLTVLSVILLGILEWVKIFDLKTNSILTLLVLFTLELLIIL